jgi:hypothetical protein
MSPTFGVKTQEPLSHWEKILDKWCKIIERLSPIMMPNDRPWWESEKANAGLIASAAIESTIPCFVETTVNIGDQRKICDLWLKFRSEPNDGYGSEQEFVELKLDEARDGHIRSERFEAAMRQAEAINIVEIKGRARIGACLYRISGQSLALDISALIRRFWEILRPDAIAWSFPECAGCIHTDNIYHLGAVLVLKKCV